MLVPPDVLQGFVTAVLLHLAVPKEDAQIAAAIMVEENVRGIDTHGVFLFPAYVARLEAGIMNPVAVVRVMHDTEAAAVLSGDNGLGQVIAAHAMDVCVEKANRTGCAMVAVRDSHHFGAAESYARHAAARGLIGLAASNGAAVMAPYGAGAPFFATNPVAIAIPTDNGEEVVVDIATSVTARSRIIQYAQAGKPIPEGWALDGEGRPTTDPVKALAGALLPMGGHKGAGLALAIEIFSAVLSGGVVSPDVRNLQQDLEGPQRTCHWFLAVDPEPLGGRWAFRGRVRQLIDRLRTLPPALGSSGVMIHGEDRSGIAKQRRRDGVPLGPELVRSFAVIGRRHSVPFPVLNRFN